MEHCAEDASQAASLQLNRSLSKYDQKDNMKRTYASVVRGLANLEDDRPRYESYSSVDSGFEGLENIQPFDIGDVERYQKTR